MRGSLASVLIAAAASAPAAQDVFPFPWYQDDLANGLRVLTVPVGDAFPDLVSLHVVVSTGSRNEVEAGKSGFAHFFEHMMFRGTETRTSAQQAAAFKAMGADRNAYTTNDYTNYHTTFGKADLAEVLELEADRFQHLHYELPAFRTEAMAVFGEYNKNSSSPVNKLFEVVQDTAFDVHTYEHTTMGFLRDIVTMPRQFRYSREFFDRWYRPEHTTLLLVGDVERDAVLALVRRYWGAWPRGSFTAEVPAEPPQTAPRTCHVPWPTPTQPWVAVAFKGPAFSTADTTVAALDLIATLAFGPDSELYRQLVVRERKVTALMPYFPDSTDPYLLWVLARCDELDDLAYVRDAVLATFEKLKRVPVDGEQLQRVQSNLRYGFAASLDSADAIAGAMAGYVARTRTLDTVDQLYARYAEVTPDDVLAVSRRFFVATGRTIATLAQGEQPPPLPPPAVDVGEGDAAVAGAVVLPSSSPLVSFRLTFLAGSADDPAGKRGLAHFTASLMARGATGQRGYEELVSALFPMAAAIDVQVDKEMTTFSGTVHRDNLEPYWNLLQEVVCDPAFSDDDVERIRLDQRSFIEVELAGNNDEELGKEVLYQELYRDHPYGWLNAGRLGDVAKLTAADAREFWRQHLRAARLVVGLAGGAPDGFADRVCRELSAALGGDVETAGRELPPPEPTERSRMVIVQKKTRATGIHIGFPIEVSRSHPDWVALWLARSWLGEHRSENSHLYQRLREARGLNYGDYAYIEYFPRGMFQFQPDPNLARRRQIFQIWIRPVPPESAAFACRAAWYELDKLVREGLDAEQFEATRRFLGKQVALLVATQDRRLGYAIDSRFYGTGDFVDTVRRGLESLTLDQVNAAIRRHLRSDRLTFVVVCEDAGGFRDQVLGEAPAPITYQAQPAAEVLAEDEIIARARIGVQPRDVVVLPVADAFR